MREEGEGGEGEGDAGEIERMGLTPDWIIVRFGRGVGVGGGGERCPGAALVGRLLGCYYPS